MLADSLELALLLEWLEVVPPVVPPEVLSLVVELLEDFPVVALPWLELEPTVPLEFAMPLDWLLVAPAPLDAEGPGLRLPETGQPLNWSANNRAPASTNLPARRCPPTPLARVRLVLTRRV